MQSEKLTNFKVFVEDDDGFRQVGSASAELPMIETFNAIPIPLKIIKHITGKVSCTSNLRGLIKFIGAGYYAKTKGKQPRMVFVRNRGYKISLETFKK